MDRTTFVAFANGTTTACSFPIRRGERPKLQIVHGRTGNCSHEVPSICVQHQRREPLCTMASAENQEIEHAWFCRARNHWHFKTYILEARITSLRIRRTSGTFCWPIGLTIHRRRRVATHRDKRAKRPWLVLIAAAVRRPPFSFAL